MSAKDCMKTSPRSKDQLSVAGPTCHLLQRHAAYRTAQPQPGIDLVRQSVTGAESSPLPSRSGGMTRSIDPPQGPRLSVTDTKRHIALDWSQDGICAISKGTDRISELTVYVLLPFLCGRLPHLAKHELMLSRDYQRTELRKMMFSF
jgi:hypothetical protein